MKIAVIRFGRFGDILLTVPAIALLRRMLPHIRILYLTKTYYNDLIYLFNDVDDAICIPQNASLSSIRRRVRAHAPDALLDFHGNLRSRLICGSLAIPVYRSVAHTWRRRLLVHGMEVSPPPPVWKRHVETVLRLCDDFGLAADSGGSEHRDEGSPRGWSTIFDANGGLFDLNGGERRSRTKIVLLPGAGYRTKQWPMKHFVQLGIILRAEGIEVDVVGSAEEAALVNEIAAAAKLGGYSGLPLPALSKLLGTATLAVGNDSGLAHFAETMGTRVIMLFGPTDPRLGFGPRLNGSLALGLDLRCRPCSLHGEKACRLKHRTCLDNLPPSLVAARVLSALKHPDVRSRKAEWDVFFGGGPSRTG